MPKPLQIPAVVAPLDELSKRSTPRDSSGFLAPFSILEKDQADHRPLAVKHTPGKPSIILLKIKAMETYSGNVERVDRRRRFCRDYVAPLKPVSNNAS